MRRSAPDIDTHDAPDIDAAGLRSSERVHGGGAALLKAVLGWAGAAAAMVAGGTLASLTLNPGEDGASEPPADRSGTTRGPACTWSEEVDGPVFPVNDLGPAPTPESVLVFERCDGEWTARIAWMHPGGRQRTVNGGDDGVANP